VAATGKSASTIRQLRTNFFPTLIFTVLKSKLYDRIKYPLLSLCILFVVEIERFNKNAVYKFIGDFLGA
jgi:hypothetical protein